MEKTILYSKKTTLAHCFKQYESCEHQHCKQLLKKLKFLSNALTQKLLREHCQDTPVPTQKQNIPLKPEYNTMPNTIQGQIEQIKKNYTKLRNQLKQVEEENDELFEENMQFKKKVQKLEETLSSYQDSKIAYDLSLSKPLQQLQLQTKNTVYPQCSNCTLTQQTKQNYPSHSDILFQNNDLTLKSTIKSCHKKPEPSVNSTDHSQFHRRYEKLAADLMNAEAQLVSSEDKIKELQSINKKVHYENSQLKKIIKLRNQIQASRHEAISGLKNVMKELTA